MVVFEAGNGGAGNKLKVGIDDIMQYGISLFDIQKVLCRLNVPRYDLGQEKRVWIMYKNRPILELGVDEIRTFMKVDKNLLSYYEQDTFVGIQGFIADHQKEVQQLLN